MRDRESSVGGSIDLKWEDYKRGPSHHTVITNTRIIEHLLEYYGYDLDQHCMELEPEENKIKTVKKRTRKYKKIKLKLFHQRMTLIRILMTCWKMNTIQTLKTKEKLERRLRGKKIKILPKKSTKLL